MILGPRRDSMSLLALLSIGLLGLTGCAEEVLLDDGGVACLTPTPEWPDLVGQQFEADAPLYVVIQFADCLSSTCDTARHADCTITLEGDRLVIESTAGYTDERGPGASCTNDCAPLEATCQTTGPLPAGSYTVTYGGAELRGFTLPGLTGDFCVPRNQR